MVAVTVALGALVVLALVAAYEQHRRRPVLEATIPAGTCRSGRRRILRAERVRARSERIRYKATHPHLSGGW
jgi:hypothetical protein